jgi:hypothetical protein
MMKVADLQQLLSGLVQPARAAGANDRVCTELQRAADCMAPFRDYTLDQFNDFLVKAEQCVRTGEWPGPVRRRSPRNSGVPRVPALSVEQAAQKIMGLVERATDAELDPTTIDTELAGLDAMMKPDLLKAAQEVGMTFPSRTSKPEILEEIRRRVREGKGALRPSHPAAAHGQPAGESGQQPVGASNPGGM